jgi:hypothetical protein
VAALVVIALVALTLTGCKSSPRVNVGIHQDGYGIYRCANGNSAVGETADITDDGLVPFGAQTEVRKDAYCANEEPALSPFWDYIEATSWLYHWDGQVWELCQTGPTQPSTSGRQAISVDSWYCGDGYYYAEGFHAAQYWNAASFDEAYSYTPKAYVDR